MKHMIHGGVGLILLLTIAASLQMGCAPRGDSATATPAPGPVLEWKEGYGGGSEPLMAIRKIEQICRETKKLKAATLRRALRTEIDVAEGICSLLEPGGLEVRFIDQPKIDGEPTDFANYPNATPPRLDIKRAFWQTHGADSLIVEDMILHELLPIVKIIDRNYSQSQTLSIALHAWRGFFRDPSACSASAVYALLAGASDADIRRFATELGRRQCKDAFTVFAAFQPRISDNVGAELSDNVRTNAQQGYTMGAFQSLVRAEAGSTRNLAFAEVVRSGLSQFPYLLRPWTDRFCAQVSRERSSSCDGFLAFLIGSRPSEKRQILGFRTSTADFDRESAKIIRWLASTELRFRVFSEAAVPSWLARAAVRSQSWAQLAALGDVQRAFDPLRKPSLRLFAEMDWGFLRVEAEQVLKAAETSEHDRLRYEICVPILLESYAAKVIDGEVPPCSAPQDILGNGRIETPNPLPLGKMFGS